MNYILFFLLVFTSNVYADEWTQTNTNLEIAYQALNYIDYRQTTYVAQHPESYYESESAWIIGKHPTVNAVQNYMLLSGIGHYLFAKYVLTDQNWRKAFQYITFGDKLNATLGNFQIGITVPFK